MAVGGNARTKVQDDTAGPWFDWRDGDGFDKFNPADRCIRFIETYCRSPKGVGFGKPLKLAEFQKKWIREILAPGIRQAVLQAPRGQGKSTLLAAMAVWATFDRNDTGEPQVPIVATTVGQAKRAIYNVVVKMVAKEPKLSTRSISRTGSEPKIIANDACGGGECFPCPNDFDTLQGLDPSFAILDEIGFQSVDVWDALTTASGKRLESLVVSIGTPGPDPESALWHERQNYLEGRTPEGVSFTELSAPEDCDYRDEAMWHLANPAIAEGYLDIKVLHMDVAKLHEAKFRLYRLAQFVEGTDCWLGTDGRKTWRDLKSDCELIPGDRTWVGVDIGWKHDTTAVVVGQWRPTDRTFIGDDGKPEELGQVLHTTARIWKPRKDQAVDRSAVMAYLRELHEKYDLVEVAYDPKFFELYGTDLADEGLPMVEFPQSPERTVPGTGDLYAAIMRREISHDGAEDYARQVLNGMLIRSGEGFRLTKSKSRGHIDAAIALLMCHARAQRPAPPKAPAFVL